MTSVNLRSILLVTAPLYLAYACSTGSHTDATSEGGVASGGSAGATNPGGGTSSGGAGRNGSGGRTSAGGAPVTTASGGTTANTGGTTANTGGTTVTGGVPTGGTPGAGGTSGSVNGSIVPLYSYPTDATWKAIASAKAAHPTVTVIAIVNPDSGPGTRVDAAFTRGIAALVSAGIVPIGYVSTDYTRRGEPTVKADIDRWHTQYPATQGIFFDEQSNTAGDEGFYRDVSAYAKGEGFSLTVGNPGTSVPASYLDTVDVMLAYESAGTPQPSRLTQYAAQRSHFGIIPYAAQFDAAYVKSVVKSVAYVYITDDDLPNPWDALPAFFEPMLAALEP